MADFLGLFIRLQELQFLNTRFCCFIGFLWIEMQYFLR